jgi:hypothetical protein
VLERWEERGRRVMTHPKMKIVAFGAVATEGSIIADSV